VHPVPDFVTPVYGWRVWFVESYGSVLRLGSVVYNVIWPAREPLSAECFDARRSLFRPWHKGSSAHDAPSERCRCGVYAVGSPVQLRPYVEGKSYPRRRIMHHVLGRVALWGTVIEGEFGWRASQAYPSYLYVPAVEGRRSRIRIDEIAQGLADYGVPVETVHVSSAASLTLTLASETAADSWDRNREPRE